MPLLCQVGFNSSHVRRSHEMTRHKLDVGCALPACEACQPIWRGDGLTHGGWVFSTLRLVVTYDGRSCSEETPLV